MNADGFRRLRDLRIYVALPQDSWRPRHEN
jgi:hypothetical protein